MEKQKSNKVLIILVCVLSVLVLALGGFIIYNNQNKEDLKTASDSKIKLSIEKNDDTGYYDQLVINGKIIKNEYETLDSVIFLDNSYVVAAYRDDIEGFARYYVYNKDGEKLYNVDELSSLNDAKTIELSYVEGELCAEFVTALAGDNYSSLCYLNQSDVYMKFESIKYLGNGKFEKAKTLSSLTVKDYLKNNYNYACD